MDNHYPENVIKKLIRQKTHQLYNTQQKKKNNHRGHKTHTITIYIGTVTEISNIAKPYNREIVHRSCNQVGNIFSRLKAPKPRITKSHVIYSVTCKDCDKEYIGQSSQRLQDRQNAHKYTKNATTSLNKHKKTKKHNFNDEDTKILGIEPQQKQKEILEMIHIQVNNETVVNDKQDTKNLSHINMPILRRPPDRRRRQDSQYSLTFKTTT
ncbi:uncharacterized protein LOC123313100 [Coccinella septempunctata]|uniref:uncharacterized protein LOC123313100 n=1 Tax=Coccinella septempunctata TaxID=41139 RepID=UPI001D099DDE|nr:uncharacterized protein LOC123313100 [Coccinella septempunctata]